MTRYAEPEPRIAVVDLDDTIVALVPELIKVCNAMTGMSITEKDWTQYDAYAIYGITPKEYWDVCIREHILENARPISGAIAAMWELYGKGYELRYLTARGWHPNGFEISKNWLLNWWFPFDHKATLHVVNLGDSKAEYIRKEWRKVKIAIDDNANHINTILDDDVAERVFLINQPWNKEDVDLDSWRIESIREIFRYSDMGYI
jgi:uncharacterized HAD superfamily protein